MTEGGRRYDGEGPSGYDGWERVIQQETNPNVTGLRQGTGTCRNPCGATRFPHVIPDVFNRESMDFPMQGHTNEGTEEKDTGFPLTTGGKDRGEGAGGMTGGPAA